MMVHAGRCPKVYKQDKQLYQLGSLDSRARSGRGSLCGPFDAPRAPSTEHRAQPHARGAGGLGVLLQLLTMMNQGTPKKPRRCDTEIQGQTGRSGFFKSQELSE